MVRCYLPSKMDDKTNSEVNDVTSFFHIKGKHLKCIPFKWIRFSWIQFPFLTTSPLKNFPAESCIGEIPRYWHFVRYRTHTKFRKHGISSNHASIFKWSKLLSPLTLINNKQMEDIRFDGIKYSHPLWDELSETIFFKNIQ